MRAKPKPAVRIAVCYCVHDDSYYLAESIASFRAAGETFVFVSRVPWHGAPGDWQQTEVIAREAGVEIVLGDWADETDHRRSSMRYLVEQGYTHAFIPDGDEIIEPALLDAALKVARAELADRVHVEMDTYWKSPEYVIRPRERLIPVILMDLRHAYHVYRREYAGGRPLTLTAEHGVLHHLSYVGPEARIYRKIHTWGHRHEVIPGWWENTWKGWDSNKFLRNIHPTHPGAYGFTERIPVPSILLGANRLYQEFSGAVAQEPFSVPAGWPRVSIVIPLYGGEEEIRQCLTSLERCQDLLLETVVVDNASPDNAADVAASYPFVRLLRNEQNTGFSAACNRGARETTGDIILFLNSDTIVPRAGLYRLIEALGQSGSIGAAGSLTNYAAHLQQIRPTYTSLEMLDLFAEDFAFSSQEDVETDILIGFCMAIRRNVWNEVGGFDERFNLGNYEDNDLSYRMRRAGYRLIIAGRSFIHHHGSRTLKRLPDEHHTLMRGNVDYYYAKWREDIETGYASHLSGEDPHRRIVFQPERHPGLLARRLRELAGRADISLCIAVHADAHLLGDALKSAHRYFMEILLVVTEPSEPVEAWAQEYGAKILVVPWTESLAEMRNVALRQAEGSWIFWMEPSETLSREAGEHLLNTVLHTDQQTTGFYVSVQSSEAGLGALRENTSEIRLFRNLPEAAFTGHFMTDVRASLTQTGGTIASSDVMVQHTLVRLTQAPLQARRQRDETLLQLDLADRPEDAELLFLIGATNYYAGAYEAASRWLQQSLSTHGTSTDNKIQGYLLLSRAQRAQGQWAACFQTLDLGLRELPHASDLHFQAGMYYHEQADRDRARHHFLGALQFLTLGVQGERQRMGLIAHKLGWLWLEDDNYTEARIWWLRALEVDPKSVPNLVSLGEAAIKVGDWSTARRMMDVLHTADGVDEAWTNLAMRYHAAVAGPESVNDFLQRTMAAEPRAYTARLIWAQKLLESGRQAEAYDHLLYLGARDVPAAAFYLGLIARQQGDLQSALVWTERAARLNPNHPETQYLLWELRKSLGGLPATYTSIPFEEAIRQLADYYDIDAQQLLVYAEEDNIGGYAPEPIPQRNRRWPAGCLYEVEGKVLYALTRILQPEVIVEIGSSIGCSTSHLALACLRNGKGTVYAVDPNSRLEDLDPTLLPHIVPVKQDVFLWTPPEKVDFLFEDGSHEPGFTEEALRHFLPFLAPGAAILSHDYHHFRVGEQIAPGFLAALGEDTGSCLITPSECGLGYARFTPK